MLIALSMFQCSGHWSGHPRGYNEAKWSLESVHAVSGFDMAGLRVPLGVFVSGGESLLVLCPVQNCRCVELWLKERCSLCDVLCEVHGLRI